MSECNNSVAGVIFGHKFRARYSVGAPTLREWESEQPMPLVGFTEIIKASKPRIYERDICERCGAVVDKPGGKVS